MTQGFSSALGARTKKRDMELHELLDICSKPEKQEDRVALLKQYGALYPELKLFLIVSYFCKDAFTEIASMGKFSYRPSIVKVGGSEENLSSLWRVVTTLYDTFPSGPKIKRGRAQRLLETLYAKDAEHIYNLIYGTFYSKELNELVVKEAFPDLAPKA